VKGLLPPPSLLRMCVPPAALTSNSSTSLWNGSMPAFRFEGVGFRVQGSGFRVLGLGYRI